MLTWPSTYYTSPDIFGREYCQIFERSWICVGRSAAIPRAGAFLRVEIGRESVLVVRNREGQLRGLLNLCRHRGARLCLDEQGNVGRSISCMYHGWTYDLEGRLVGAPYIDEFPGGGMQERSLHPVAVTEWLGYVWVNLASEPPPLAEQVDPLLRARFGNIDVLARYGVEDLQVVRTINYDVQANWKIIFENFCECYHCPTMHPELCAAVPSFRSGYGTVSGPRSQGAQLADHAAGFSLSGQATAPFLPGLPADDERIFYGVLLWPNVSLILVPDHVVCLRIEPQSVDCTRVVAEWLFHPHAVAEAGFDPSDAINVLDVTNRQDFEASERVQLGAGSAHFEQIHHPYEYLIADFRRWVDSALTESADE